MSKYNQVRLLLFTTLVITFLGSCGAKDSEQFSYYPFTLNEDFDFLKDFLNEKSIVLLGEQSHGDGSTVETKVALIKYLHKEMGYDLVIFESGFYDAY